MTDPHSQPPTLAADEHDPSRLRLSGRWTLRFAPQIAQALAAAPADAVRLDASGVDRLDTVGVLQLRR